MSGRIHDEFIIRFGVELWAAAGGRNGWANQSGLSISTIGQSVPGTPGGMPTLADPPRLAVRLVPLRGDGATLAGAGLEIPVENIAQVIEVLENYLPPLSRLANQAVRKVAAEGGSDAE